MTWCRQGRYFYRSRREGRRVVSEYVGCGELGALLAKIDNRERREQEAARQALREEAQEARELDSLMSELRVAAEQATTEALLASGYHQHKRTWRRRRRPHEC